MQKHMLIFSIVILAALLRFINLTGVPPSLNSDEVAIGYNAYSILTTGKDEFGLPYPLVFRSFDDYKMPVDVYMIAASMKIFGYSDFAVRFPSALFGTLTVFVTYLLVRKLWKGKGRVYGLVAAFLLAVSPWSILFSRAGYGSNIAVFFSLAGVYFALLGFRRGWFFPLSAVLFVLSIWSYHSSRIFVPLILFGLAFMYWKSLRQWPVQILFSVILASALLLPLVTRTFSTEGKMRAVGVSAFSNPDDLKPGIAMAMQDKKEGMDIFSFFHNRRFQYVQTFLYGYFSHFDLNFLFLDKSMERYRAPGMGLMYLFELPFFIIGLYQLIRKWSLASGVVLWWLSIAPVAAAFTLQFPHPGRTQTFLPVLQIITAVGLVEALWGRRRMYLLATVSVVAISIVFFIHQYFVHLPVTHASNWYVGRKEMVQEIAQAENEYDQIIVSNALDFPYIFYLYYRPVHPASYIAQGGTVSGGFLEENNRYANVSFRSISSSLQDPGQKILFVGLPHEVFTYSLVLHTIYNPDGSPAIVFFK